MDAPDTVTDAVALLEAAGYASNFEVTPDAVVCPGCARAHPSAELVVERTFGFEGATDPGDEAIVLGVACPSCNLRGIVVSAYGPDADPHLIALVERLQE